MKKNKARKVKKARKINNNRMKKEIHAIAVWIKFISRQLDVVIAK